MLEQDAATGLQTKPVRGAVTGLGVVNILIGLWEAAHFTRTTRTFQQRWQSHESDPQATDAARLSDYRPADADAPEPRPRPASLD